MPDPSRLTIDDIAVSIVSKRIRRVNLRIIPPDGSVIVSKPHQYPEEKVIAFVRSKLQWIRTHQERIRNRPWAPPKQYTTGEKHMYLGKDYVLEVIERRGKCSVSMLDAGPFDSPSMVPVRTPGVAQGECWIAQERTSKEIRDAGPFDSPSTVPVRTPGVAQGESWIAQEKTKEHDKTRQTELFGTEADETILPTLVMTVPPGSGKRKRKGVLEGWYREQLEGIVPGLVKIYEKRMGVEVSRITYRTMRSRWGSCNLAKRSITVNTEMGKKSLGAIESLVVHELVHLLERKHNRRFYQLMSQYYPDWKSFEKELKSIDS